MNTTTEIENEIISTITSLATTIPPGRGDREWTNTIKRGLIVLGKKKGYTVCASEFPDLCEQAWLYDLVWYRNDAQNKHLAEIGLVLESEWLRDPEKIRYDFEKLLIAKSPLKVMIFQDFKDNLSQLWTLLEDGIRAFRTERANEKYILVVFREDNYAFEHRIIAT
jgi:hypothetical protein